MSPILFPLTFFYEIGNFDLSPLNPNPNENSRSVKITWLPSVIYWPSVRLLLLLPEQLWYKDFLLIAQNLNQVLKWTNLDDQHLSPRLPGSLSLCGHRPLQLNWQSGVLAEEVRLDLYDHLDEDTMTMVPTPRHQWQHRLTSQLAPLWCPTAPLPRPKPPEI